MVQHWTVTWSLVQRSALSTELETCFFECGQSYIILLWCSWLFPGGKQLWWHNFVVPFFNRFTPNDPYMGRTAPLTSKCFILCIYSTNISTEYFKHALFSPFFFSSKCSLFHNANLFDSYMIHILYTGCAKIKIK